MSWNLQQNMSLLWVAIALSILYPCHGSNPNLNWLSFYGFDPADQYNYSYGIDTSLDAINAAYLQYKMVSMLRLPSDDSIFIRSNKTLNPNWQKNLELIINESLPFLENGTIVGYFIGDEICCAGIPYSNLTSVVNYLRNGVGDKAILYENECEGGIKDWQQVPTELNWISIDHYDYKNGTQEYEQTISVYNSLIFPILNKNQKALFVPGIFACNETTIDFDSQQIVQKLDLFFNYALNDTRIKGLNPWHFNNRSSSQHAPPCVMEIGAIAMPNVIAKLEQIGQYILNNK